MNAKERLIDFLKSARVKPDLPYTFTLDMPVNQAKVYVHRMRVELTRFRTALRERGERIRAFKMIVQEMVPDSLEPLQTHVTLLYVTNNKLIRMQKDISEVFELVATGEKQLAPEIVHVKAS
mgnify:CR=1 FL=1